MKKTEKKHRHFGFHSSARRDDDIAHAARNGDLPAVRGHLRRDRGCLDRVFGDLSALHWAASRGHRAVVAFLVAKGAAVDVLSSTRGELSDRRRSRRRQCHSAGAEVKLRCILQQPSATWSAPSSCWQQRPPWKLRTTSAGGLSRCPVFEDLFFFTGNHNNRYNRCSSTNEACLNDLWHIF